MIENLFLSIIIPLYNKQDYIYKTLQSVLSQEYLNFEIVIVDDGSTDNSVEIVEKISDERIHLFRKSNGGPASARNYGVQRAQGKWVLFLDADDTLETGALTQVESDIRKHRFADVFCYSEYVQVNGKKILYPENHFKGYVLFPFLKWFLRQIYPGPGRMVVRRKCLLNEPFREDLKRWEDGECIFRLMRKYRFYANPIPLFSYCQDSLEASRPRQNPREDFICNMQPEGKSFFEQLCMYKLYKDEAKYLYSNDIDALYGDTFNKVKYWRADKYLHLYLEKKLWNYLRGRLKTKIKELVGRGR